MGEVGPARVAVAGPGEATPTPPLFGRRTPHPRDEPITHTHTSIALSHPESALTAISIKVEESIELSFRNKVHSMAFRRSFRPTPASHFGLHHTQQASPFSSPVHKTML